MPKKSEKAKIFNFIVVEAENEIEVLSENEYEDEEYNKILDEAVENVLLMLKCHRGIDEHVPKSHKWRNEVLSEMDDGRLNQMLRVTKQQFTYLVTILEKDLEFQKSRSSKQFSVELQVAIVVYRLGSYGENAAIRKIASIFGVGDGGTIDKITFRVFNAILRLQHNFIHWPDKSEREQIVAETYHELPNCVGYVDGTEIKLAEAPIQDHVPYFSKSRFYSIKAQVAYDHKLRIRHFVVGHVGSCHDAKIYKSCSLYSQEQNFFNSFQWIAGDSAYPLSRTVITPYRSNSQLLDKEKRKAFNLRHSRCRVRVEHCFGVLKEMFGSLKELRMQFILHCDWFIVCCILHNMLIVNKEVDTFTSDDCSEISEDEEFCYDDCGPNRHQFEIKRQALYRMMFE